MKELEKSELLKIDGGLPFFWPLDLWIAAEICEFVDGFVRGWNESKR